MDAPDHDKDKCWSLKHKVHDLLESGQIVIDPPTSRDINQNPLPAHLSNPLIQMISTDYYV